MQTSDTLEYLISQGFSDTILERFWEKVNKFGPIPELKPELGPCWLWTATLSRKRGMICKGTKTMTLASRVSWMIHFGPIPEGLEVCHHCDNPSCVCAPSHLFLGTHTDNMRDMMEKERQARGEGRGLAKLTNVQVKEIAATGRTVSLRKLGAKYGVHPTIILDILNGNTWTHITGLPTKPLGVSYWHKLNAQKAEEIRKLQGTMSKTEIGKLYGVNPSTIGDILHGRTWKHTQPKNANHLPDPATDVG